MPARPKWLMRIPDAVRQLEQLERDIITRRDVQKLFGVSKSMANTLMLRDFGAERTSHLLTVPRTRLLSALKRRTRGREFQREETRQEKLYTELHNARIASVRVRLPATSLSRKLRNLPDGVTVGATRITVDYTAPRQAIERLIGLAHALGNDYDEFEKLVKDAGDAPRHRSRPPAGRAADG